MLGYESLHFIKLGDSKFLTGFKELAFQPKLPFERSTFDSWDFFIWGNLSDLEMLLQKPVENENDGYISKDLLKGLLVRIQDQIQIFRQTIPYFVTDRSSEMPIRIIICEL